MENASKALIIAGAILISIVLVSVGVIVVQSLNPDEALSQMDQQAIDTFNSKFVGAAGTNVRGSVVRSTLQNVITSNTNNETNKQILVKTADNSSGTSVSNEISAIINTINTAHRYTVVIEYGQGGIVSAISITDNNA